MSNTVLWLGYFTRQTTWFGGYWKNASGECTSQLNLDTCTVLVVVISAAWIVWYETLMVLVVMGV